MYMKIKGFTQIDNRIIKDSRLSNGDFRVYVLLKSYKFTDDPVYPSQSTLASILKIDRCTVNRSIQRLVHLRLIRIERRGFSSSNLYYLDCDEKVTDTEVNSDHSVTSKVAKNTTVIRQKTHIKNTQLNNTKNNNTSAMQNIAQNYWFDKARKEYPFLRKHTQKK